MRLVLLLALCGAALAVAVPTAGAGSAPRPPEFTGDDPDPTIADGSAQRRLDAARRRWRRSGIKSYRFDVRRSCFCPPDDHVVIFVRDGRPLNAPPTLRRVATVPRLLREVQRAIDDGVVDLDVRFDRRGVPRRLRIDGHRMLADDEVAYRVVRFWRGTRGRGGPDRPALAPGPGPIPR